MKSNVVDMTARRKKWSEAARPRQKPDTQEQPTAEATKQSEQSGTDKEIYQGFETGEKGRELYLDFRDKNGDGCLFSYSYIVRIQYKGEGSVHLTGTDFIITLQGRNLGTLIEALHDENVRYVQEWNETHFYKPKDDEPLIEMLKITEFNNEEGEEDDEGL